MDTINEVSSKHVQEIAKEILPKRQEAEQNLNQMPGVTTQELIKAMEKTKNAEALTNLPRNNNSAREEIQNLKKEDSSESMNDIKEPLKLIEEAYNLITSIFEVDNEIINTDDNKISRKIKDKDGKHIDVVSVEDELFPYVGNAKQQFNQKVIAKINDMIEGKATLEDLIQLVRRKKAPVKESLNKLESAINILENVHQKRLRNK